MSEAKRIFLEIESFLKAPSELEKLGYETEIVDTHGFVLHSQTPQSSGIDLLVTALVHGDEVIGVEALNAVIRKIRDVRMKLPLSIGFLLCNVEAAKAGVRFLETDLNRSFLVENPTTLEQKRAVALMPILKRAGFVLDLHQTVEPTETPFFIFEHRHHLIETAHALLPQIPIVTFPSNGFSAGGKTMLEFASTFQTPALAVEWGQKGFSASLTATIVDSVFELVKRLSEKTKVANDKNIFVYHLTNSVPNPSGKNRLVPGLTNFMEMKKGQLLAHDSNGQITAPFDGRIFFPKYGVLATVSPELADLGQKIEYKSI